MKATWRISRQVEMERLAEMTGSTLRLASEARSRLGVVSNHQSGLVHADIQKKTTAQYLTTVQLIINDALSEQRFNVRYDPLSEQHI